jgi:hypothetical protein
MNADVKPIQTPPWQGPILPKNLRLLLQISVAKRINLRFSATICGSKWEYRSNNFTLQPSPP